MGRIIAGVGVLEGLTALLVLFGDRLGGYFFVGTIIMTQIATNGHALTQVIRLTNVGKIL